MKQGFDFRQFVDDLDGCWIDSEFDNLSNFLAGDVVYSAPDGKTMLEGHDAVIESYRNFMATNRVEFFSAFDHRATERDQVTIVEYSWNMVWHSDDERHEQTGREILVLSGLDDSWKVIWRMQIAD